MSLLFQDRHELWTCQRQGIPQNDKLLLKHMREDQKWWRRLLIKFVPCVNELRRRKKWMKSKLPDLFVDVFSITIFISVLKLSCRIPGLDLNSYFEAFHDLSPRFAVRLQNV